MLKLVRWYVFVPPTTRQSGQKTCHLAFISRSRSPQSDAVALVEQNANSSSCGLTLLSLGLSGPWPAATCESGLVGTFSSRSAGDGTKTCRLGLTPVSPGSRPVYRPAAPAREFPARPAGPVYWPATPSGCGTRTSRISSVRSVVATAIKPFPGVRSSYPSAPAASTTSS